MSYRYLISIIALFVLLIILQVKLWIGKGSLQEVRQLEADIVLHTQENKNLRERNDALHAEVKDLKRGLEAFDERARLEFGMIRRDETFFQIINSE